MNAEHLARLGRQAAAEQDAYLAEHVPLGPVRERLARACVARKRGARRRKRYQLRALAAAAVVGFPLVLGLLARAWRPLTFTVAGGAAEVGDSISPAGATRVPVTFSDGTQFGVEGESRLRVVRVDARGAELALEFGRTEVSVVPGRGGRWLIDVGPYEVLVTGTRFDLHWLPDEDRFELSLLEGSVSLSGCAFGEALRLKAGEVARAECRANRYEVTRAGSVAAGGQATTRATSESDRVSLSGAARARRERPSAERGTAEPALHPTRDEASDARGAPASSGIAVTRPRAVPDAPSPAAGVTRAEPAVAQPRHAYAQPSDSVARAAWRGLAREGSYAKALSAAVAQGFEGELSHATASDAMLLSDTARFAGDPKRAQAGYLIVRRRFPGSGEAATAGFNLGRLASDRFGDAGAGARWFRTYLRERPHGSVAREARGRLMELLKQMGDLAGARLVAREYLSRYPSGPHARLAGSLTHD